MKNSIPGTFFKFVVKELIKRSYLIYEKGLNSKNYYTTDKDGHGI